MEVDAGSRNIVAISKPLSKSLSKQVFNLWGAQKNHNISIRLPCPFLVNLQYLMNNIKLSSLLDLLHPLN